MQVFAQPMKIADTRYLRRTVRSMVAACPIKPDPGDPGVACPYHVALVAITDHERPFCIHSEGRERECERAWIGLARTDFAGDDNRVDSGRQSDRSNLLPLQLRRAIGDD